MTGLTTLPVVAHAARARTATALWALRSPCAGTCIYCYFSQFPDTSTEPASAGPPPLPQVGRLSHTSPNDLTPAQVLDFATTLGGSRVGRVVIAGGEPLNWVPTLHLLGSLREQDVSVTIATSGMPLNRPKIIAALLDHGVEAVSVSLDSIDPVYNDRMRPFHDPRLGWTQVVSGITALADARGSRPFPQIGIYSVITKENLPDLAAMAPFAAGLGVDYYVPQPLSLPRGHALKPLCLTADDAPALGEALAAAAGHGVRLPAGPYPDQFASVISTATTTAEGCFGGEDLFFVQPDGSVWPCPSGLKIAGPPAESRRSILDGPASSVFGGRGCADCTVMSDDCVAMFPLVRDRGLYAGDRT